MFYPIAIRILSDGSVGAKKLAPDTFYYFVQGIKFSNDGNSVIFSTNRIEDTIYTDIKDLCDNENLPNNGLNLTFSALVGANGSGKSTLVELFVRLVNNFSACIIGEVSEVVNKPHLHFINGVFAELYFIVSNGTLKNLYRLKVDNRHVSFSECEVGVEYEWQTLDWDTIFDLDGSSDELTPISRYKASHGDLDRKDLLEKFFYTYVSNFSIYAYNHSDYPGEYTSMEYERKCRRIGALIPKVSERHWLEGMFHRKEAYQVPILLYPSRNDGNIDIKLENELAYSRFLSSIISEKSRFLVINDHLKVTGFHLRLTSKKYDSAFVKAHTGYRKLNKRGYEILRDTIIEGWNKRLPKGSSTLTDYARQRHHGDLALDYLCYKTLKISSEYTSFHKYFFKNNGNKQYAFKDDQLKRLRDLIVDLSKDWSHLTRKIRATLFYLMYGLFDYTITEGEVDVESVSKDCAEILQSIPEYREDIEENQLYVRGPEDLVPPPFFKVEVLLKDLSTDERVSFNSMSSGEKQIVYSLTGILMLLVNLDSIQANDRTQTAAYKNVNVILEEIELYFHPDLQRRLIYNLIAALRQTNFIHVRNVNFLMVTHSPFVLSDIPSNNILALNKEGRPVEHHNTSEVIRSFAANIHDILRHPFFLEDGAVGKFAQKFLEDLGRELGESDNRVTFELGNSSNLKEKIDLIDEPIVHKIFMDEYRRKASSQEEIRLIDEQIRDLQKRRDSLTSK